MSTQETEFVSILGSSEKTGVPNRVSTRSLPELLPIKTHDYE